MNSRFNLPPGCTANDVERKRTPHLPKRGYGYAMLLPTPEATGDQLSDSQRYLLEQHRKEQEGK